MQAARTEAPAPAGQAYDDFWLGLDEFLRALRSARGRAAANVPPDELTISQYKLLEAIVGRSSPRIGEIAVCLDVAPPTATRMIAALEREGLIERHSAPDDRRAVTIELTSEGREARKRAKRRLDAKRMRLYESLDPDDRAQAARLLKSLAEGMDAL
jgi:DNA-binding MarR family transcriptional regulator